jgi:desulfoferrodoxin-like iron-binding protein
MKTYVCQVCGHIAFDQAPVDCPVCKVPIENFENVPEALKKPLDPENLTEDERMHTPLVKISKQCNAISNNRCIDIQIKVGAIEHEMTSEHFINFIDIYIDRKYVTRAMLTPKRSYPLISLCLNVTSGSLSVISNCSVHGNWRTKVALDET